MLTRPNIFQGEYFLLVTLDEYTDFLHIPRVLQSGKQLISDLAETLRQAFHGSGKD